MEEDDVDAVDSATTALPDVNTVLANPDSVLEIKSPVLEETEASELVSMDEAVIDRLVSTIAEEKMTELSEIGGVVVDKRRVELLLIVGIAMLIGADEVVFAYGATTELGTTEVRLIRLVVTGTDVFNCTTEAVVESGRVTELLAKTELVGIELFVKIELVDIEELVKAELVGMELLVITGVDVLKCTGVVMELFVIGTNPIVLVVFRRGVGVTVAKVAVMLVIMEIVDTELLLGRTLLEVFMTNDDEVIIELDVVSGAAVEVQLDADAKIVTVLSYNEVTSIEKVWLEY